jgi:hypothetical protein
VESSYGLVLSILKVLSDALTAAFGILGLLTDFRNETTKRITRTGWTALGGIIIGLLLSATMSLLERKNANAEEERHRVEVQRASHHINLSQVTVRLRFFVLPKSGVSEYTAKAYNFLKSQPPQVFVRPTLLLSNAQPVLGQFPTKLAQDFAYVRHVEIYKRGHPCSEVEHPHSHETVLPDLSLQVEPVALEGDPQSSWMLTSLSGDSPSPNVLMLTVKRRLLFFPNPGTITSWDDFQEATVYVDLNDKGTSLQLEGIEFTLDSAGVYAGAHETFVAFESPWISERGQVVGANVTYCSEMYLGQFLPE